MLFRAIEFAARAHAGQYRKQTKIPYIVHPLAVCQMLIEAGCRDEVVVAAVLHDTIEDTSVTLDDIESEFGNTVAELVLAATEPARPAAWEIRKQHTIDSLRSLSRDALYLICADKLHNIFSIRNDISRLGEEAVWARFSRNKDKQRWYFESLLSGLSEQLAGDKIGKTLVTALDQELKSVFGRQPDAHH